MKPAKKTLPSVEPAAAMSRRARTDIGEMRRQIEAAGAQARREIEGIREAIRAEKDLIVVIERSPVSETEMDQRIDQFIAEAAASSREGRLFDILSAPSDSFSSNALWNALGHQKPFELLACLAPDLLRAGLKREGIPEAVERNAEPLSMIARQEALRDARKRLRAREAEEEIAARALDEAGLSIDRRTDVPQAVRDASIDELEALAAEA
jgi:hypothetical protein